MLYSFNDGRLFGALSGSEPRVILALHGWGRSHRDFDAVLAPAGHDALPAVALDLPGFGVSPPPPSPWGSAQYAACVAEVIEGMSAPVIVIGHSFGGRVAITLAAHRPELVRGLVLTGVPQLVRLGTPRQKPRAGFRVVRALHRAGLIGEARMEATRQRYGSSDYRAATGVMRQVLVQVLAEDYGPLLGSVTCPVDLVWADDDSAAPVEVAKAAADRLERGVLTVCPGAGHLTPRTVPDELHRALVSQLGRVQ